MNIPDTKTRDVIVKLIPILKPGEQIRLQPKTLRAISGIADSAGEKAGVRIIRRAVDIKLGVEYIPTADLISFQRL